MVLGFGQARQGLSRRSVRARRCRQGCLQPAASCNAHVHAASVADVPTGFLPPRPPGHPQLTERRSGNAAYRARDFQKALHHYERAQAVVEFVQVGSRESVPGCSWRPPSTRTTQSLPPADLHHGEVPAGRPHTHTCSEINLSLAGWSAAGPQPS